MSRYGPDSNSWVCVRVLTRVNRTLRRVGSFHVGLAEGFGQPELAG